MPLPVPWQTELWTSHFPPTGAFRCYTHILTFCHSLFPPLLTLVILVTMKSAILYPGSSHVPFQCSSYWPRLGSISSHTSHALNWPPTLQTADVTEPHPHSIICDKIRPNSSTQAFYFQIKVFNHLPPTITNLSHKEKQFRCDLKMFLLVNSFYTLH
jgi:hypothetical protein